MNIKFIYIQAFRNEVEDIAFFQYDQILKPIRICLRDVMGQPHR